MQETGEKFKKEIFLDNRLKEMNLGDWEMKKFSSIPEVEIRSWEEDLLNYKIPNGETNKEFFVTIKNFTDEINKLNFDEVFIVAHAGSINGMISNLTGEPFDKLVKNYWEKISYGSLSLIVFKNNLGKIEYLGK